MMIKAKRDYFGIIGYQYINRGNKKLAYVEDVLPDLVNRVDVVHYRLYENIDVLLKTPYRDFKPNWKNNGFHIPILGRIYKHKVNEIGYEWREYACVEKIRYYSQDEVLVQYTSLAEGKSFNLRPFDFNRLYRLFPKQE